MTRKLKPYKIERVTNQKTGIGVDIMLDREDQTFFGMVGPTRIEGETAAGCKRLVRKALKDFTGLQWGAFIVIDHAGGDAHEWHSKHKAEAAHVELRYHRLLGARTIEGTWVERPFEEDTPGGYHFGQDRYVNRWHRDDESGSILPYTEAAWGTLCMMRSRIEEIATYLENLTKRDDFVRLLNNPQGEAPLLGAGNVGLGPTSGGSTQSA
jgi:hypothetical protein